MKKLLLLLTLVLITSILFGQTRTVSTKTKATKKPEKFNSTLVIDGSYTPEELVSDFFNGTCVQVSNIIQIGGSGASGFFWADQTSLGIPAGILITSGSAAIASGPNDGEGSGASSGGGSDPDLVNIGGATIFDANGVEFDFVSSSPVLKFNYIFGSDEYPEYGCSNFNDVFGFFISGPGFIGNENVALLPNTDVPVRINTINAGQVGAFGTPANCTPPNGSLDYSSYYVDNPVGSPEFEYDGLTIPISSKFTVIPGETYHAKLVVADVGDAAFDSGVFIGFSSLCGDSLLNPKQVLGKATQKSTFKFNFSGQAKYATSYYWNFGDDTGSYLKNPGEHTYIYEGVYKVQFIASNYCCSDTSTFDLNVKKNVVSATAQTTNQTCHDLCDGSIVLNAFGGFEPYTFNWSNGANTSNISGLCKGNYIVTITDVDGLTTIGKYTVTAPDPINIKVYQSKGVDETIITKAIPQGGTPPYLYNWSDGITTQIRTDIKYGQGYSVKVTDKFGCISEIIKIGDPFAKAIFKAGFNTKIQPRELNIIPINLEKSIAELRVFNIMGQIMWTGTVSEQEINLDTRNWSSGIYYIQMRSEEGVVQKSVFIK